MKALILSRPGPPSTMAVIKGHPKPQPGPGDALVRIKAWCVDPVGLGLAVGLNPVDYKVGENKEAPKPFPFILGLDGSGIVEELGPDVVDTDIKVGDEVYWHGNLARNGAYAEYCVTSVSTLALKPKSLTFAEASALPCAGFTAFQAIVTKLKVKKGDAILITGGAGGVGSFAIQLAALAGASPIITTTSKQEEHVRKLGATHVINYKTEDIPARVMEITKGQGVIGIVDTVSTASCVQLLEAGCLAPNGGIVPLASLGGLEFKKYPTLEGRLFSRQISIHFVALGPAAYFFDDIRAEHQLRDVAMEMGSMYDYGRLEKAKLLIEQVKMEGVPEALERIKGRHVTGKIVMVE